MEQYRHFERHPHPCWRTPHGRPHNPHPHALLRRKLRLGQIESKSELPKMVLFGLDSPRRENHHHRRRPAIFQRDYGVSED